MQLFHSSKNLTIEPVLSINKLHSNTIYNYKNLLYTYYLGGMIDLTDNNENRNGLPLVALRGLVVFPKTMLTFDVGRSKSIDALDYAVQNETPVFLVTQKNAVVEEPAPKDLYKMGVVTTIKQVVKLPGNMARILAEGIGRAVISEFESEEPFFKVYVENILTNEIKNDSDEIDAYIRTAHELFEQYALLSGRISTEVVFEILQCKEPGVLADAIGIHIIIDVDKKQMLLEELDDVKRLTSLLEILDKELNVLKIQKDIYKKVRDNIEKHQKDYFLREQIKIIKKELGEHDGGFDNEEIRERMDKQKLPEYVLEKLNKEISRLERMSGSPAETAVIKDYLDWVLDLPWSKKSKENTSLKKAEAILNKEHYGLENVKERIVEFLAVRLNTTGLDAPIICLVGPPGVGKTSVAKSVAHSLNRKYVRMSLGGVRDEAEIRGHRKTYIGAMPGRIIHAMKQAGTTNPLILLDEIDKMSSDFRGNPGAALLEVLDGEQNINFRDHYLELPYDLSDVLFICTANSIETIPDALLDRLEIIEISSYSKDEKLNIAKNYLIEKQIKKHGANKNGIKIKDCAINDIIEFYTKEAGVRQLERTIGKLIRKAVREMLLDSEVKSITFKKEDLFKYLGKQKYRHSPKNNENEPGIATGLAWTRLGGSTMDIEVNVLSGSGKLELTGNLGDVMKESAKAAISFIRSKKHNIKIPKKFYQTKDIHIHIPEGAVPKDGPSAGITMATAMLSALSKTPVRTDVAMTGEITIRGRVLPIGGLKEKILAAKTAGIKTVLLPKANESDLHELSDYVKEGLKFELVENMEQVLDNALCKNLEEQNNGC